MSGAAAGETLLREAGLPALIAQRLAARGPHEDLQAMCGACDRIVARLSEDELRGVLNEVPAPEPKHADEGTREAARLALEMYRDRFGYPFVSGIDTPTAEELLMRVRIRLGNDPAPEWRATREHLRRLLRLRLARLADPAPDAEAGSE